VTDSNSEFIPYGRQAVDEDDIRAVSEALRAAMLTTGPRVAGFEDAVCRFTGAGYGVAVSSGTAALHAAMHAIGAGKGDEVIVPAITFLATANAVVYQGAKPVFADIAPDSLLLDPADVEKKITPRTRAIIAVDYAGQPCDYDRLRRIAECHNLVLVADACHSLGGTYKGKNVGQLADLTVFSFHPVKHITTGEGGMVVTDNKKLALAMRRFRNHGIDRDHRQRENEITHRYDMTTLGYNYRLSDIQCALGISQLRKLPAWLARRQEIAAIYQEELAGSKALSLPAAKSNTGHAWHLYVVQLAENINRDKVFREMRARGIGVNVHYRPVYLNSFYQEAGYEYGLCPIAEKAYERLLSLPMYPGLSDSDVKLVAEQFLAAISGGR